MDKSTSKPPVTLTDEEEENSEVMCLKRVGKSSGWFRLFENTEVTIGRGADVTYQLLSPSCPLMISRLHCAFKQREDGQWMVTDRKSMNGVWVNQCRLVVEKAHLLHLGDSIQLGVPVPGAVAEFNYVLIQSPLRDVKLHLSKPLRDLTKASHQFKKPKRKLTEETEPCTSSKRSRASEQGRPLPTNQPPHQRKDQEEEDMDSLLM